MPTRSKPRAGSLQFWPRKRADKILPSANWSALNKDSGLMGFISYKVGMISVYVKDNTPESRTKGQRIIIPATILECPTLKIFSVRFYRHKNVVKDIIVSNDKELKAKLKLPKQLGNLDKLDFDYDDVRVIAYTSVKDTSIKKTPDMVEIGLAGSAEEKLNLIKEKIKTGFSITDVFTDGLVDVHGVTIGRGLQGPVKRFGISLKSHKSEKGVRRPGSLGGFGLRRVIFRAPQAGQTGYFTRVAYNSLILKMGKISEENINPKSGFHKYGNIKTDYIILKGSVPGPKKRPILITTHLRPTKKKAKQSFEILELR